MAVRARRDPHTSTPAVNRALAHGPFVPNPSTGAYCQLRSAYGLRQTVRGCPLMSAVGRDDCHSLRHLVVVCGPLLAGRQPTPLASEDVPTNYDLQRPCQCGSSILASAPACRQPVELSAVRARRIARLLVPAHQRVVRRIERRRRVRPVSAVVSLKGAARAQRCRDTPFRAVRR